MLTHARSLIITSPLLLALGGCVGSAATPADTPAPAPSPVVIVVTATPSPTDVPTLAPVDTPIPFPSATPDIVIGRDERQKMKDYALAIGQKIKAADTPYRIKDVKTLIQGAQSGTPETCPPTIQGWRWKTVSQEPKFQKALELLGRAAVSQSDSLSNTREPLEMYPDYYIDQLDELMRYGWIQSGD